MLASQKRSHQNGSGTAGAGRRIARRPTRGLEIKDDTYAILKLIRVDGKEIGLIDSSSQDGETTSGYANFMLQSVQEARMEKYQIVETFGESYIFFFGESPRFLDITAVIINSNDFNWEAEWWENYNRYLRGTKSVELGARTYLFYDDNIVEGYMLMAQAAKTADNPLMMQLTFRMFVTNYQNISFVGDPSFPIRASVDLPPDVSLSDDNAGQALIEKFRDAARAAMLQNGDATAGSLSDLLAAGAPVNRTISEILRSASPSIGVSPDVWAQIQNLQTQGGLGGATLGFQLRDMIERVGRPIRGLIAENVDEYVGAPPQLSGGGRYELSGDGPVSMLAPQIRSQQEVDDLFRSSIETLSCFGADINDPTTLNSLGLGVNFGQGPGGAATFKPTASVSFGFGATEQVGFSSGQSLGQFQRDPLGAVYGSANAQVGVFGSQAPDPRNRYAMGGGDPGYGYPSDFASGPGFGVAGFGDMGGQGFGSGTGAAGDPGYRDPSTFTFAGVSDNQDAFNRFLLPRPDPTVLTTGQSAGGGGRVGVAATASTGGLSGGASVAVQGKPSPFAMVAISGTLDETGNARLDPAYASNLRARQTAGFTNPNPFGVQCAAPSGSSITGFNYQLP